MADPVPPQPLHNPGSPAPPRDGQFGQMFQSSHRWSHPSPAPPAQPQPLLLGQNNRVLVKISVCPPPKCHDQYTRQRTGSVTWGAAVPWGWRGTRGCGGCLCVSSKTSISPSPGSRAGGSLGGCHSGGFQAGRAPPPRRPSPPGPAAAPTPGSSRGAPGGSGCKTKGPIKPCPHLQLSWKHPAPRHGSTRDEAALLPLPALPPPFMGPFGLGRPCPCVPHPWESRTCSRRDRTAPVLLAKVHRK